MNGGMLVFHNGSNTSYANHSANLSSMSASTEAITLRFIGQGASATATSTDVVVLEVAANTEERVMEFLARAFVNPTRGMMVVADDNASVYASDDIEAVTSISVDSGAGTFKNVVVGAWSTNNISPTVAQSGSIITIPVTGDNSTITLPTTPPDGTNYKFICEAASLGHTIIIAGSFEGFLNNGDAVDTATGTATLTIASNKFEIGDSLELTYAATAANWKVAGHFLTDAACAPTS